MKKAELERQLNELGVKVQALGVKVQALEKLLTAKPSDCYYYVQLWGDVKIGAGSFTTIHGGGRAAPEDFVTVQLAINQNAVGFELRMHCLAIQTVMVGRDLLLCEAQQSKSSFVLTPALSFDCPLRPGHIVEVRGVVFPQWLSGVG